MFKKLKVRNAQKNGDLMNNAFCFWKKFSGNWIVKDWTQYTFIHTSISLHRIQFYLDGFLNTNWYPTFHFVSFGTMFNHAKILQACCDKFALISPQFAFSTYQSCQTQTQCCKINDRFIQKKNMKVGKFQYYK